MHQIFARHVVKSNILSYRDNDIVRKALEEFDGQAKADEVFLPNEIRESDS